MKTNHFFKLATFLLLFAFLGCQKEEALKLDKDTSTEIDENISITESSFDDAFQDDVFKSTYLKYGDIKKNTLLKQSSKTDPELYNFSIDGANIKTVKVGGFISYTLPIHRKIISKDYFENLVLQTNTSGEIKAFILKYTHNGSIELMPQHDSFKMEGTYQIIPLEVNKIKFTALDGCYGSWRAMCDYGGTNHVAGGACHDNNNDGRVFYVYVPGECQGSYGGGSDNYGSSGGGSPIDGTSLTINDPLAVPSLPDGTVVNFEEDMALSLAVKLNITDKDQIDYLIANFRTVIDINAFLDGNNTVEGREFVNFAIETLAKDPDDELNNFLVSLNLFQDTEVNFDTLLDNFENIKGSHFDSNTKKEIFSNYCAINLSHALLKSGIKIDSKKVTTCWGCEDKTYKNKHAIRAQELADWLGKSSIDGVSKVKVLTGENFEDYVSGKKGIIFFKDYWQRDSDSGTNRTGDHIDLWNGNALVSSSWFGTWFRLTFPELSETFGSSDLSKSKEVLFWEIK